MVVMVLYDGNGGYVMMLMVVCYDGSDVIL